MITPWPVFEMCLSCLVMFLACPTKIDKHIRRAKLFVRQLYKISLTRTMFPKYPIQYFASYEEAENPVILHLKLISGTREYGERCGCLLEERNSKEKRKIDWRRESRDEKGKNIGELSHLRAETLKKKNYIRYLSKNCICMFTHRCVCYICNSFSGDITKKKCLTLAFWICNYFT